MSGKIDGSGSPSSKSTPPGAARSLWRNRVHDAAKLIGMELAHAETMEKNPIRVLLVESIASSEPERLIQREMPRMSLVGKASSLEEAVNAARKLRPDVILLDIDLKDKNGFDLLPGLLQPTQARVIALTNSKELRVFEQGMLAGHPALFGKPNWRGR